MAAWTIGSLLETVTGYLRGKGSESPRLDAELLLAAALGMERIQLYTQYDRPLTSAEVDHYRTLVARRARHEPVAYILGRAHFRRLTLEVTPAVLIPRPETEELVELALESLLCRPVWEEVRPPAAAGGAEEPALADVGTGSGAIALSLAQETGHRVLAVDRDPEALAVAARNRAAAGLDALVELREADLLTGMPEGRLRLIVANLPYVTTAEMALLAPDVGLFEPSTAFHGGADGLDVYRRFLPQAARALGPGGRLFLEVGHEQAATVCRLAASADFALTRTRKDLSGKDRFVVATRPGALLRDLTNWDGPSLGLLARALGAGAVIGLPTDTVYGLAARWDCNVGVRRLFAAKGRASAQPVAVLFPSVEAVTEALPDLEAPFQRILQVLLPGPFTLVVPTKVPRPPLVGTEDSLGVRVPDHPALLAFLARLGTAVAATSANLSGGRDVHGPHEVDRGLLAHCSVALTDGVEGDVGARAVRPSTVVDLRPLARGERPVILREGAVSAAATLARIATVDTRPT